MVEYELNHQEILALSQGVEYVLDSYIVRWVLVLVNRSAEG